MGGGYVTSNMPTTWNLVVFHPCSRPPHWRQVVWWHRSFFPKNWWDFPLHLFASLSLTWYHISCRITSNIWCFTSLQKTETCCSLSKQLWTYLHRLWQASHICMCWATAIKNLQHCSRQSSFCWCTPTTSMGKVSVAYETSWNLLSFLCWSLCYQSSAPCKDINSLQDILINCWQDLLFLLNFLVGLHLDQMYSFDVTQMPTSQWVYHRYSSKDDKNINSTIMSLCIFVFLPWEWQFLFVQGITSCLMLGAGGHW